MYRMALASTLLMISNVAFTQESPCNSRERTESYTEYHNARKATDPASQKKAFEVAQLFTQKWAQCDDQYSKSAREFIALYELTQARLDLHQLVFGSVPNHSQAFGVGKKILARQPDDLDTLMALSFVSNAALQKGTNALDTLTYAAKAAQLIESGKTPTSWVPFKTRSEALANLHLWIAEAHWPGNKDADAALPFYQTALTMDSNLKNSPVLYGRLASVYEQSAYERVKAEYRMSNVPPGSYEQRKEFERLNHVIDRLMDYYARAVATAGTDPKYAQLKYGWKEAVTQFYKFRNKGTTQGLDDFIAKVMNTPLPR